MKIIKLSKSIVGQKEKEALAKVIDNSYLGMGSFVKDFEEKIKGYLGAKNVVCVNSGTAALHLALMALGLKPGDEVLVQSLTFVASFQAITAAGLKPIACEILPETCAIDLKDAKKKITKKTKVIMPVHYASRVGNLDEIYAFAEKNNLRIVEDAAHAFGGTYKGKKVGSFGDVVCFSFDGIKNITCGEGGAIVTADEEVAKFAMDARLLGVHKDTEKRYSGQRSWEFDVHHQGYRYHMSNLFAAIGLAQLERLENEFKPARQKIARRYNSLLEGMGNIVLFKDNYTDTVPHIFPVRILNGRRDNVREKLIAEGVECGIHYCPSHLLSYFGAKRGELPVTEKVYGELLSLPLHPEITESDQSLIVEIIKKALK
ncbi:MAG: DegT/DnrJ/EryC1/StrS family aminotransferase [Elusimicrobia bacterium]|nr:DegT/DnrJ/EryC1/StrS family aminotransferase [Elusimicrobiota bacterium]